jgi:hypothetical protein
VGAVVGDDACETRFREPKGRPKFARRAATAGTARVRGRRELLRGCGVVRVANAISTRPIGDRNRESHTHKARPGV